MCLALLSGRAFPSLSRWCLGATVSTENSVQSIADGIPQPGRTSQAFSIWLCFNLQTKFGNSEMCARKREHGSRTNVKRSATTLRIHRLPCVVLEPCVAMLMNSDLCRPEGRGHKTQFH